MAVQIANTGLEQEGDKGPVYGLCLRNDGYPTSLEVRKIYRILPSEPGEDRFVRVIDESGEDYLYPEHFFAVIELPESVERALAEAGSR